MVRKPQQLALVECPLKFKTKKKLTLDQEKFKLLKSIKSVSTLKGVEAIMLAKKLGYKEPMIRVHEAKNYIKQLKLQYNLK